MTNNYKITGKFNKVKNGLVDYVAAGYIERDDERIPCEIGFTVWGYSGDPRDRLEEEIEATHIFIKDGVTENGTHYNAETIEI